MSFPDPINLAEAARRGCLTPEEEAQLQAYLRKHPELRGLWEEELGLSQLLRQMPDLPISSNFTARVLNSIHEPERATGSETMPLWSRLWKSSMIMKAVVAVSVGCITLVFYQHHRSEERRQMAESVIEFSKMASSGAIELFQNFDAIARLGQVPRDVDRQLAGDRELIAALQ